MGMFHVWHASAFSALSLFGGVSCVSCAMPSSQNSRDINTLFQSLVDTTGNMKCQDPDGFVTTSGCFSEEVTIAKINAAYATMALVPGHDLPENVFADLVQLLYASSTQATQMDTEGGHLTQRPES